MLKSSEKSCKSFEKLKKSFEFFSKTLLTENILNNEFINWPLVRSCYNKNYISRPKMFLRTPRIYNRSLPYKDDDYLD
jgi:hypothetical protein